jgi:hypothetical protein
MIIDTREHGVQFRSLRTGHVLRRNDLWVDKILDLSCINLHYAVYRGLTQVLCCTGFMSGQDVVTLVGARQGCEALQGSACRWYKAQLYDIQRSLPAEKSPCRARPSSFAGC